MSTRILPAIIVAFALGGCASNAAKPAGLAGLDGFSLEFPDVRVLTQPSAIIHEVKLYFEMDRPPREERGQVVEEPIVAPIKRPGEVYAAGYMVIPDKVDLTDPKLQEQGLKMQEEGHVFSYQNGAFVIGGFRYPAERNGHLFLFTEREGDFTVIFQGHRITVERDGPWRPAVLYRELQETKEVPSKSQARGSRKKIVSSRVLEEEVRIGPHRIVIFPGRETWQVNQYRVPVAPGASIWIDPNGAVRTS